MPLTWSTLTNKGKERMQGASMQGRHLIQACSTGACSTGACSTGLQYGPAFIHAVRACSTGMQYRHVVGACSMGMQYRHVVQACSRGMQYRPVVGACSTSMKYRHAVQACIESCIWSLPRKKWATIKVKSSCNTTWLVFEQQMLPTIYQPLEQTNARMRCLGPICRPCCHATSATTHQLQLYTRVCFRKYGPGGIASAAAHTKRTAVTAAARRSRRHRSRSRTKKQRLDCSVSDACAAS